VAIKWESWKSGDTTGTDSDVKLRLITCCSRCVIATCDTATTSCETNQFCMKE
jgi:uncharacterized protein YcbX